MAALCPENERRERSSGDNGGCHSDRSSSLHMEEERKETWKDYSGGGETPENGQYPGECRAGRDHEDICEELVD
eukprot:CAMPEP_0113576346 /NCGR_PEP_ID=MMETSP0015_2-20120614/28246_1 /TAXON_ID=2838 /ORGANISM="Odontella" /LENGTH=73 /DNA_ID=CAMNT_0000479773 /DNA_START=42 /DNA_END=263 /DNA_ORIENTATION=- /assembly_acc=CAM_ASM_000160